MSDLPAFKVDVSGNLGKKNYRDFTGSVGTLQGRIERDGQVIQEKRQAFAPKDLNAYLLEEYDRIARDVTANQHPYCKDKSLEEVFLEYALPRYRAHVIYDVGMVQAFASGDFSHLYRALATYIRYYYACDVYLELIRGRGFANGTGTDHCTYHDAVTACFAIMRPDYAKRFYPQELGLVRRSHASLNRLGSLVMALLYDDDEWKAKALKDARKSLEGKRQISERAVISYMVNLYDSNADGMSADLQTLMDNYRRAGWLIMGEGCRLSLHAYYLMAKCYLPAEVFAQVRRPRGPGWWDGYIDLCLQEPLPATLEEPFLVFDGPLAFLNKALEALDLEPPPESMLLSIDIKRQ